ncbi:putative disease resistance protein RGA4 [Syzygium oleosum]|uniref:putative disease resistance protein RGA4 n=1 Tax=Syzygium oleosum TaxID=219896 RepID=UPI0024B884D4|nr:putative disease resistance protein RGA4 [Syzygium oleosum]
MAEAVLGSIAKKIVDYLVPQAIEQVGQLWFVHRELKALGDTVSTLQAVVYDAEEQYYHNRQIQVWLERLKDAFYDAQDVLEEFSIEAMQRELSGRELSGHNKMLNEVRAFFSSSNQLAFKLKMIYKVRAVRVRIEAIKADKGLHLVERPVGPQVEREWRKRQETDSFTLEGDIRGRDDDKKTVLKFLLDTNVKENVSILPIVGIGGLGKTALAQYVYNDEMVSKHFHLKMWVCVSDNFDMNKIVTNIIACATKKEPTKGALERLQSELRATIDEKRYLLVLDDLWNEKPEKWLSLKKLLVGCARGSKILITTCLPSVAKITGTASPHLLGDLSESASIDLLMQMACRKEEEIQDPEMLVIAKEIARKCSGVPLVVRTVGHLLSFKETKLEWLRFKDDKLPQVNQSEDSIRSVLELSYNHLPSHLKQCFAFCSLFPKDYKIKKQTLVDLWVAGGFIEPSNEHLEDVAHEYFIDLLRSNFFQNYKKDEETCQMHDLMHDLSCLVAGTGCGVAWDDKKSIHERTRHLSVGDFPIPCLKASPLRTFLSAVPRPRSEADICHLMQSFKRLNILDLHDSCVVEVPRSICKLKFLTYLDLSHNHRIIRLPDSITRLHSLQTLNLYQCAYLVELPMGIRELVSLRNLDIDGCQELSYMPHGLGQLSSLHRLTRFILPKRKVLTENYCGLGELNGLNNIRGSLSIENLGYITDAAAQSKDANLIGKDSLESLELRWGYLHADDEVIGDRDEALLDGLRPHSNLQKLEISVYNSESFPRWMMDDIVLSLPNLVEIRFYRCQRCKHLPPLGQLPRLKYLEIRDMTELEYIKSNPSCTLTGSFPCLSKLMIENCRNLKTMPPTPHLEDLILSESHPTLINQTFGLNKLKTLDIRRMLSLECLSLESLTSLEKLRIIGCHQLTSLSLGTRPLSNLVRLSIGQCASLDLSNFISGNILDFQGLESLRSMEIFRLPKLESLPQWLLQLTNLERLKISYCSNLKALLEQIETFQSLQRLEITDCPSLTSLPDGIRRMASLNHLNIYGCRKLEEKCKKDGGVDWYKIAHISLITHQTFFDF